MPWGKIFLILLGLFFLGLVVRAVRGALRFKRRFDDFSVEAGERLLHHAEQVDSTLERWHEYDEAYQEAAARLEEEQGGAPHQPGRGATLGPTGGSFRKPN
ncbi:MAG: hypothetical protein HY656_02840 [Acidobacteria bacterium]|nr:hypothetical protein [Acidobacteriota bacterium]